MSSNRKVHKSTFKLFNHAHVAKYVVDRRLHLEDKLPAFLQAVIDDDRATVRAMLDKSPRLVALIPLTDFTLQSKHTHQTFYAENALTLARKRNQLEMVQLMLPYFAVLEHRGSIADADAEISALWTNSAKNEHTVSAHDCKKYIKSLVKAFTHETFPNGLCAEFSQDTEAALKMLLKFMLPNAAVRLDEYIDVEEMLNIAHKSYNQHYDQFKNDDQRNAFCVRVIGFLQSLLSPEAAKVISHGMYDVLISGAMVGERASSLKIQGKEGHNYYRESRLSQTGLGFAFMIGWAGTPRSLDIPNMQAGIQAIQAGCLFRQYTQNKAKVFAELEEKLQAKNAAVATCKR